MELRQWRFSTEKKRRYICRQNVNIGRGSGVVCSAKDCGQNKYPPTQRWANKRWPLFPVGLYKWVLLHARLEKDCRRRALMERKKLCKDAVRDALRSVDHWPLPRNPSSHDFTEEERFRMFRAVMHGHVWPVSDIIRYEGRLAFSWTYSVWSLRRTGESILPRTLLSGRFAYKPVALTWTRRLAGRANLPRPRVILSSSRHMRRRAGGLR